jgi:DNA (cytosine-5)-methyltransferase 1
MFGLDVQRHRIFECSFPVPQPKCDHDIWTPRFPCATNRTNLRKTVEVGVYRIPLAVQKRAMGIDWMSLGKLSQAIPPAYAEYLGRHALQHIIAKRACPKLYARMQELSDAEFTSAATKDECG